MIPDQLPARSILEKEGITVITERSAARQDIRPLRIGLLNLMPDKIGTETQVARLLGGTPLQIELSLVRISHHVPRNASANHMATFYRPWNEVRDERFDGFIITGAPVERLSYENVSYWAELCSILDWTQTHTHRSLAICWAAQAALFHFYGIAKRELPQKAFGIFEHRNLAPRSPILRGFSDMFDVPVSRWSEVSPDDLADFDELDVLADSSETGACLVEDRAHRTLCMFNHLEYDTDTLRQEYIRDGSANMPAGYFVADNPRLPVRNSWRCHAHLLFGNWLNEIYQSTPFDFTYRAKTNPPAFMQQMDG